MEDLSSANNAVKGRYNTMASLLNTVHSRIWKIIKTLKKEQILTQVRIWAFLVEKEVTKQRKKYADITSFNEVICNEFGNYDTMNHFRGIVHNFQYNVYI